MRAKVATCNSDAETLNVYLSELLGMRVLAAKKTTYRIVDNLYYRLELQQLIFTDVFACGYLLKRESLSYLYTTRRNMNNLQQDREL